MKREWGLYVLFGLAASMLLAGVAPFLITFILTLMGYGPPIGVNWWLQILLCILSISILVWSFRGIETIQKHAKQDTDE